MNFQVSDKVVCVSDGPPAYPPGYGPWNWFHPNGRPIKGQVYTVSHVYHGGGTVGLVIVGYPSIFTKSGRDVGYAHTRFRKLEEVQLIVKALKHQNTPCPHTTPSSS